MLIQADSALAPFPDKIFHCVTTSPPYWGLRKYTGLQERGLFPDLGLEENHEEHIYRLVQIFAEVHRVLRDDGVLWLNYGDCYAGSGGENANTGLGSGDRSGLYRANPRRTKIAHGNMMLLPHKIAIALQEWGWIVRNDVVWHKPNPMPEPANGWRFERDMKIIGDDPRGNEGEGRNATLGKQPQRDHDGRDFAQPEYEYGEDYQLRKGSWRHTRSHEYVFMLTKQMQYWGNLESVREKLSRPDELKKKNPAVFGGKDKHEGYGTRRASGNPYTHSSGRNPRSVLTVTTSGYSGKHYAVFPPKLIAPLIMATCPRWACPVCGQGWSPVVEKGNPEPHPDVWSSKSPHQFNAENNTYDESPTLKSVRQINVKEYRPTCEHDHAKEEAVPGIVFDPFVGSGTTVMTANQLMRRAVGVDISMEYLDEQAKVRTGLGSPSKQFDDLPMFDLEEK